MATYRAANDPATGAASSDGASASNPPSWGGDLSDAGNYVSNNLTPAAPAGASPSARLAMALRAGNYGSVPGLLLHAGLRGAIGFAPVLAAGMTGPEAAAAVGALQAAGGNAYARAANNGRATPNDSDVLGSLPADAGAAAAGYLLPGGSKTGSLLGRVGSRVGSDLASGAVGSAASQLGDTVGTDNGASLDPSQMAADALTGAAIGAGRAGKDMAGDAVQAGGNRAMQMTRPAVTSEDQANALTDAQAVVNNASASDPSATQPQLIRSASKNLNGQLVAHAKLAKQYGLIDPDVAADMLAATDEHDHVV